MKKESIAKNMILGKAGSGMSFTGLLQECKNYIITDPKNELKETKVGRTMMNEAKGEINIMLAKSNVAVCYVCGKVKERSDMKYIHRGLSLNWIPACQECRDRYQNNKLLKHFVKVDE